MKTDLRILRKQDGVVSIIVSITIMIILSLIVIGFARLMRREERQALDRQLSSQAYYAAESAINDAAAALSRGQITTDSTTCDSAILNKPVLDPNTNNIVEYSCVTLDATPNSLEYDNVSTDQSTQFEVHGINDAGNPSDIKNLTINWQNVDGGSTFEPTPNLTPLQEVWGPLPDKVGIVRLEMFKLGNLTGQFIRDDMLDSRKVFWLYPNSNPLGGTTASWSATANGSIVNGGCSSGACSVTINDFPPGSFLIRMRSIYAPTKVSMTGVLLDNSAAGFSGAQVIIDATGRANDVLRRMSARVALNESYPIPEFALQAFDGICKTIEISASTNTVLYDTDCRE